MVEDWISNCAFREDRTSKKGKELMLFEDVIDIQDKSERRGPILFEDSRPKIRDKNSPKRTYFVDIQMGYVPCRGRVVSHVKFPGIMLLNEVEVI